MSNVDVKALSQELSAQMRDEFIEKLQSTLTTLVSAEQEDTSGSAAIIVSVVKELKAYTENYCAELIQRAIDKL